MNDLEQRTTWREIHAQPSIWNVWASTLDFADLRAWLTAQNVSGIWFCGAGPLVYAAREAALKVMELSAGAIPALWDSTFGFRHSPKSFVIHDTFLTEFVSSDPATARYDRDLVTESRAQFREATVHTIDVPIDVPFGGRGTLSRVVAGVKLHPVKA